MKATLMHFIGESFRAIFFAIFTMIILVATIAAVAASARQPQLITMTLTFGGLYVNLLYLAAGRIYAQLLFFSPNYCFFEFSPMTLQQFLSQNRRWHAGALLAIPLIMILGLLTILIVAGMHTLNGYSVSPIMVINWLLTAMALTLSTMVTKISDHKAWEIFNCSRRFALDLYQAILAATHSQHRKTARALLLGLGIIALGAVFFWCRPLGRFILEMTMWVHQTGLPGRALLFLFSPMSAVAAMSDPALGRETVLGFTVALVAFNLACLSAIHRHFSRPMDLLDRQHLAQWLTIRELAEEYEENQDIERETILRPLREQLQSQARSDGLTLEESATQEVDRPAAETAETNEPREAIASTLEQSMAQDRNPYPEHPDASPLDVLDHERAAWNPINRAIGRRRPWHAALRRIGILIVFIYLRTGLDHTTQAWSATIALALGVYFIYVFCRRLGQIDPLLQWSYLIPVRWSDFIRRQTRLTRWQLTTMLASGAALGWLTGGTAAYYLCSLAFFPLTEGFVTALLWLLAMHDNRRSWGKVWVLFITLSLILALTVLAFTLANKDQTTTWIVLLGLDALQAAVVIWVYGLAKIRDRKYDGQMIYPPGWSLALSVAKKIE